jgi:uncharacterized DUF497 family protein
MMKFVWNSKKAAANLKWHRVSFAEAREAFYDLHAVVEPDDEHSWDEQRYRLIGASSRRLLFIIYTELDEQTIRIISAREVEPNERRKYYEEQEW